MKKIKYLNALAILSVLFLSQTGCNNSTDTTETTRDKTWRLPVSEVAVVKIPLKYSSTGSVVTDQRIDVASPTTGFIRKIVVPTGKKVTKGQTLVILESSNVKRQRIRISSPVTGVVVTRHKRVGDITTPRETILTVKLSQGLIFETYVTESRIGKVKLNDPVTIYIDALDTSIAGTVARRAPSGDPITRRYRVKIALPEHDGLLPGMFGRSHFRIGTESVVVIPRNALLERGGLQGSFIVDNENKAHFRWLRIGKLWPERVEVRAGLQGGERIVTVTETRLRDGDLISTKASAGE